MKRMERIHTYYNVDNGTHEGEYTNYKSYNNEEIPKESEEERKNTMWPFTIKERIYLEEEEEREYI